MSRIKGNISGIAAPIPFPWVPKASRDVNGGITKIHVLVAWNLVTNLTCNQGKWLMNCSFLTDIGLVSMHVIGGKLLWLCDGVPHNPTLSPIHSIIMCVCCTMAGQNACVVGGYVFQDLWSYFVRLYMYRRDRHHYVLQARKATATLLRSSSGGKQMWTVRRRWGST